MHHDAHPLVRPLSNGEGAYWCRCHVCRRGTPVVADSDPLTTLAAAQRAGWSFRRRGYHEQAAAHEQFRLYCPPCVGRGRMPVE